MSSLDQKIKGTLAKIKTWLQTHPFPGILSFFIKKDGTINPSVSEAIQDAAPQNIWDRVGLGKLTSIGLPVWFILAIPIVMIAVKWGGEALQFFILIISQAVMLIPLAVVLYFIWKSFKK